MVKVNFQDVTYDDYPAQIWTVVEISVAIIVACLPVCRIVIEYLLPVTFLPSSRRYIRTRDRSHNVFKGDNTLTGSEQQAQDVYSVLDEEIGGLELNVPEPAATLGKKDRGATSEGRDTKEETAGYGGDLWYTAEANRASGDATAKLHGKELEGGNSITIQHDVVVTRQGRVTPTAQVI